MNPESKERKKRQKMIFRQFLKSREIKKHSPWIKK